MADRDARADRAARWRRLFAALSAIAPDGPAAVEQLRAGLDRIPVSALRTEESSMTTPTPPAFSPALDQLLERVGASVRERVPGDLSIFRDGGVLAPPLADPTRPPRRVERPRLQVRAAVPYVIGLPAAAPENLTGQRAERYVADWHVIYRGKSALDDYVLGTYGSPRAALASLDHHLHEMGLVEDLVDPFADGPAEGGVSDAA